MPLSHTPERILRLPKNCNKIIRQTLDMLHETMPKNPYLNNIHFIIGLEESEIVNSQSALIPVMKSITGK